MGPVYILGVWFSGQVLRILMWTGAAADWLTIMPTGTCIFDLSNKNMALTKEIMLVPTSIDDEDNL